MRFSATNAHAAWRISDGDQAGQVKFIDFDTLETRNDTPDAGQSLRVLGFMNEDVIYGIVLDGDSLTDENGHTTDGITLIRIEGFDGTSQKGVSSRWILYYRCDGRKYPYAV